MLKLNTNLFEILQSPVFEVIELIFSVLILGLLLYERCYLKMVIDSL